MNSRRMIVALCFALLCSGLFTWQLNRHMTHHAVPAVVPMHNVVVAAKELAAGEVLTPASLNFVSVPAAQPLQGLLSRPQDVVGRVLFTPLSTGEPITLHELASADTAAGLAASIPDGMRIVSLPASEQTGDASLLTPGSHVDVFVSYHSDPDASVVSSLVLQDIAILRSNQKGTSGADAKLSAPDMVNLLVTTEEAARLTTASALGKLTFALRNGTDKSHNDGLARTTLLAQGPASSPSVRHKSLDLPSTSEAKPRGFVVETLSGGKSSVQTFSEDGR